MKENIFDFDVMARGSFIDNVTGGDTFKIEMITIRLNYIALNEWLDNSSFGPPECYNTDAEWEQHKAEIEQARIAWEKAIIDRLGIYEEQGKTSVTITQSPLITEVFVVFCSERISSNQTRSKA
jgi:hypothetical protein